MEFKVSCVHPITVVNPRYRSKNWDGAQPYDSLDYKISVPCGHCILCRRRNSSSWHFRLYHEALHTPTFKVGNKNKMNIFFVTFTFSDEHLPDHRSITHSELRSTLAPYIRIWRDRWRKRHGVSPRYFCVTDIGGERGRLHLHLLIFNPVDKQGNRISLHRIFRTAERWQKEGNEGDVPSRLQMDWPFGFCTYASYVNGIEAIHYVSGYINNRNVLRSLENGFSPMKHGKKICSEALSHVPCVFVSQGLGRSFIRSSSFAELKKTRRLLTKLGHYIYAVPRYYRLYYFEDFETPEGIVISREDQLRAWMSTLIHRMYDESMESSEITFTLLGKRVRNANELDRQIKPLKQIYGNFNFTKPNNYGWLQKLSYGCPR